MAIKVNGIVVIDNDRSLKNISNLKTVCGQSILGSGDIDISLSPLGSLNETYTPVTEPRLLLADGSTYLQSSYPALYAAIGQTYKTKDIDTTTQFQIPKLSRKNYIYVKA
jgi:hypothetical protein